MHHLARDRGFGEALYKCMGWCYEYGNFEARAPARANCPVVAQLSRRIIRLAVLIKIALERHVLRMNAFYTAAAFVLSIPRRFVSRAYVQE